MEVEHKMAQQIQLRRDTAENWTIINPILAEGEVGVETDTLKIKIGDGITAWNDLEYIPGSAGGDMVRAIYDTNQDGIVDDSDKLDGQEGSYYATASALGDKVDKITGKGLSTEDYTTTEKSKLANIAENANNYTHPANHDPSIITQDTNNRFVTDAEKSTWNAKSDLALGELSTNAYRGDRGKTAYDHTSLTNNPHTVTKAQVGLTNVTDDAQVKKRASSTGGNIPTWNGSNGDALTDGYGVETTLSGGSTSIPRADAVKTYVDNLIGANDAMVFKGAIDCSANPNYSAGDAGHTWKVSVAGKIGGASGPNVEVGDMIICTVDSTSSGDHATVGSNFNIIQVNIDGSVIGPASSTNNRLAAFDGVTGKLLKDSGYLVSDFAASSHVGATGNAHGVSTTSVDGFMSSTDKTKLDGVATSANNYTHPANHDPSIITQDTNNRFVTDTEKSTWNAKSNLALGETDTTAYRGDRGKTAYDHSQVAHAPSDAQKNSDITKAEIEAKLTGSISSHDHTGLTPGTHASTHITGGSDVIANATTSVAGLMSASDKTKLDGVESNATADMTANEILTAIKTVDGTTSGLDADLLDGQEGSHYATASNLTSHTGSTSNPHTVTKAQVGLTNVTDDAQVKKRASSTSGAVPTWNGATGDALNDGYTVETTLTGSSTALARADAVKTYVDNLIGANDAMVYKGVIDCSANPNYSAGSAGHTWKVSVSGKIGGASGPNVEVGDMIICTVDGTASGTHAAVGANFNIIQVNIDGAVIGPASSITNRLAAFDGVTGKLLKDSGYLASDFAASSHVGATGAAHGAATTSVNGFMSSTDKTKLDGVATNANNYTHPANHAPSIITQDTNNRFVTDTEKSTWNAKSNLALGETDTTAYRGDRGKTAYDHSQVAHAPSDAQKNSDITKAEIEAKLTGAISSHSHTGLLPGAHASSHITGGSDIIANATTSASGLMSASDKTKLDGVESNATADMTANEILTAIKTVDGTTSGLDADLLDGQEGSHYATASNLASHLGNETDAHGMDNLLVASYLADTEVTQSIISLPSTNIETSELKTTVKGNTVTNLLADTVAGCESTTGWSVVQGTLATDSDNEFEGTNCLKQTLSAGQTTSYNYRNILASLDISKYYLISIRLKNGNATTGIRLETEFVSGGATKTSSYITATSYTRVGIVVQPSDMASATQLRLQTRVTGTETQYAFVDALMLQEITATEYALGTTALLSKYAFHRGTAHTEPQTITSVGKNLFNKNTKASGYLISSITGNLTANVLHYASDWISVTPSTSYRRSGSGGAQRRHAIYDINKTFISGAQDSATITIPANGYWIKISDLLDNHNTEQVELGTSATTYEPYKDTVAETPIALRSVPVISDTFDVQTGIHTKNVSDEYSLVEADIVELVTSLTNVDYVKINKNALSKAYGSTAVAIYDTYRLIGYSENQTTSGTSIDNVSYIRTFKLTAFSNEIAFVVAKGTYASLATAKTALAGTKLYYQIATPTITNYDPQILQAQKSGTVYLSGAGTIPTTTYSYGTTIKAQVDDNSEMIDRVDDKVESHIDNVANAHGIDNLLVASYSTNTEVTQSIISLPSNNIERSELKMVVKGNTVTNKLPDTIAGCEDVTSWGNTRCVRSLDSSNEYEGDNCIKMTLSAGQTNGYANYSNSSIFTAGKYYFVSGYLKNGNLSGSGIRMQVVPIGDNTVASSFVTSTSWTRVGVVVQPTDFDASSSIFIMGYIDGAENQYGYIDALMVQEITATEYALGANALLEKYAYHRDTAHTQSQTITSVGKNLLQNQSFYTGYDLTYPPYEGEGADTTIYRHTNHILLGAGTYIMSSSQAIYYKAITQNSGDIFGSMQPLTTTFTLTKTEYVFFNFRKNPSSTWDIGEDFEAIELQLEQGSSATTYEEYKETVAETPVALRNVPAISDSFDVQTGVHTKNVSNEYSLVEADITNIENMTNVQVAYTGTNFLTGDLSLSPATNGKTRVIGKDASSYVDPTNLPTSEIGKYYVSTTGRLGFVVALGTYATLAAAKTALAGTKVYYQLATPTITTYDPQILQAQKSGTVYSSGTGTIPTTTYSYGTTIKAQINDNSDMIVRADKKTDNHLDNMANPHSYEDEGTNPDYTGVQYRFVVKDGEFYLEVVSA